MRIGSFFRSLRFRIFLILFLIGLLSCMVIKYAVLAGYETHAVEVRENEVQTQLRILANHLITYGYLEDPSSEVVNSELNLLANLYDGRVLVMDDALRVVADTYELRAGKTIISEEVVRCLRYGNDGVTTRYDDVNGFIEITTPIVETVSLWEGENLSRPESAQRVRGVMLTSVSTSTIAATLEILNSRANRLQLIVIVSVLFFAIFASNLLLKPFDRISRAIREVKAGYTDEPINVPDYPETQHITDAFNEVLSRMKVLDDSRQEFVSNVSHELKTPITSMKVLADTLIAQENAPVEMYRDFLTDISDEIVREDNIINDLLALVRMDRSTAPMNITQVNIVEMTEIVLKRLRPIARQRNIELTMENAREITAEVDEVKLSLAIMNLVENAIKYNREGGWVRTELDADHANFTIRISDSGIGIPEEELAHIYERFYRVDKSRSREIGGTGLGLSVTREAVLMHRGEIEVQSTEDVGTVFTLRIPLLHVQPDAPEADRRRRGWFFRRVLPVVLLWFMVSCGAASGRSEAEDADAFRIYYVNAQESGLVSEVYAPESDPSDTEAMLEEMINVLQTSAGRMEYEAPMTGDIVLREHRLEEGLLTLDFDVRYLDRDPVTEILDRAAIVRTFSQIEGVDGVIFLVAGQALMRGDEPVGVMTADTFIYNAGSEINSYDKVRITLYFAEPSGEALMPVYRSVVYNSNMSMERLVTEQLLAGPQTEEARATLSENIRVTNVTLQDNTCYIDFSEDFLSLLPGISPEIALYSLVNSLTELYGVERVQISVGGQTGLLFGEQIPLDVPFSANPSLLRQ
ncbi:MAG: GerMN domain-containing protein [Lachnospiraceae bacterium]|nr:GerMN domain-containing protein [Lachnospiraceae bacterium]